MDEWRKVDDIKKFMLTNLQTSNVNGTMTKIIKNKQRRTKRAKHRDEL